MMRIEKENFRQKKTIQINERFLFLFWKSIRICKPIQKQY